ncbi:MAG: hypothetical protein ACKPKO_32355 [Candidatus Fonsibacter sp.]
MIIRQYIWIEYLVPGFDLFSQYLYIQAFRYAPLVAWLTLNPGIIHSLTHGLLYHSTVYSLMYI